MKIRSIAIHLPQFHPIPENDTWWGKGFTEWTNVAKAKPLFNGHYQPHLPADLGFYDLRLEEARDAQAAMAKAYGIYGFCYYHYWFNGKKLLNKPVDEIIATGKPDFPFMLCWANENWTRRWDGLENEILLKQDYNPEDDLLHIQHLHQYFKDPRYIRVHNKPFFIIYKPNLFPDIKSTVALWRAEARRLGIGELYLGYMNSPYTVDNLEVFDECFDAAIEFSVHGYRKGKPLLVDEKISVKSFVPKVKRMVNYGIQTTLFNKKPPPWIQSYKEYIKGYLNQFDPPPGFKLYPSVFPGWDNSARKGKKSTIFLGNHPSVYEAWLKKVVDNFQPYSEEENFVFINAWNEWAEGNHLEPCQKWGTQYLEATKRALDSVQ